MNRRLGLFVLSIVVITTVIVLFQTFKKQSEASTRSVINGIESFTVEKVGADDHYYLFYPADHRVSQGQYFSERSLDNWRSDKRI